MAKKEYIMSEEHRKNLSKAWNYEKHFTEKSRENMRKHHRAFSEETKQKMRKEQLGKKLDIHHIDFNKKNNNSDNLISLCKSCHTQTQFNRQNWTDYFQNKLNNHNLN